MSSKPVLYSLDFSPPARTVCLVARAIGLELDVRTTNVLKGEHRNAEYERMNPQHTIPTLDDNGFYLWESAAICTYLIDTYATPTAGGAECGLYPTSDRRLRALIDQRLYWNAAILFPEVRLTTIKLLVERTDHMEPAHLKRVHRAYEHLELFLTEANDELEQHRFMVGTQLTLADLALVTTVTAAIVWAPLDEEGVNRRLVGWMRRCAEAIKDYEELNAEPGRRYAVLIKEWLEINKKAALEIK